MGTTTAPPTKRVLADDSDRRSGRNVEQRNASMVDINGSGVAEGARTNKYRMTSSHLMPIMAGIGYGLLLGFFAGFFLWIFDGDLRGPLLLLTDLLR